MNRKYKKYLTLLLILSLAVGFAYLSASLNVDGHATIRGNTWDIYFDNVQVLPGSIDVTKPTINEDGDTVDYSAAFESPGEKLDFTVDIVNDGTLNGAIDTFTKTILDEETLKYVDYKITYKDGSEINTGDIISAKKKKTILVHLEYKEDDILEEDIPGLSLSFTINYKHTRNKEKIYTVVSQQDSTKLSIGDEIAIGTEHFYVLNTDDETTTLFAKENLYVGINNNSSEVVIIDETDANYGKQITSELKEQLNFSGIAKVPYSGKRYWLNDDYTIKSKYGESVPIDAYDKDLANAPDYEIVSPGYFSDKEAQAQNKDYTISYYVENYVKLLNSLGADNIKGRLLTDQDLIKLGFTPLYNSAKTIDISYDFIKSGDYWTSTIGDDNSILQIYSNTIQPDPYFDIAQRGVRPVIEVPTEDITE